MKIYFEIEGCTDFITAAKDNGDFEIQNCDDFITTAKDNGEIVVRCRFVDTDYIATETLDEFVARHGGVESTAQYLKDCSSRH